MASNRIKGITIEIGGNTTKLQDALKGVDKQIYGLNADLKDLDKALKLDPSNTELLKQKYDVLERSIDATKERLNSLKEAQKQMGDYTKLTEEQKSQYNALSGEIAKTESNLKSMQDQLHSTAKIDLTGLKNGLEQVGKVALDVSKKMLEISTAVAGALAGLVGAGVKSYAELEKAQKGAERLFGDSFDIVKKDAESSYKSMGLSATEYYNQVNNYAVGLKEALGGDSKAAAQLSGDILKAQADIVASTGASQEAVQNAFSAVMRGNYTMLDNMRIGIKGTKGGMEEVIKKVNEWNKANGNATKYQMGNYADMQKALVDYTKMIGITGTAEKQLSTTISGSVSQMKSAFDNFLNGSGSPQALSETVINTLKNITGAIQKLAPDILRGVVSLAKEVVPQIAKIIVDLVPELFNAVSELIDSVLELVSGDTEELQKTISTIVNNIVEFMTENLPKIIEIGLQLLITLAETLANNVDTIIPAVIDCIITIVDTLLNNIDKIIDASIELIVAIAETLTDPEVLEKLIKAVPKIIITIVEALIRNLPKIVSAGVKIIGKLIEGMGTVFNKIKETAGDIITKLFEWLKEGFTKIKDVGKELISGLWSGLTEKWDSLKNSVKNFGEGVVNKFKNVFGISSPSKVFKKTIGVNLALGIEEGFTDEMDQVNREMSKAIDVSALNSKYKTALRGLSAGVSTSVNPSINPSYSLEINYQLMAKALKEAIEGMGVVLDDREVGQVIVSTVEKELYN